MLGLASKAPWPNIAHHVFAKKLLLEYSHARLFTSVFGFQTIAVESNCFNRDQGAGNIGSARKFVWVFHFHPTKKPNELYGRPNISLVVCRKSLLTPGLRQTSLARSSVGESSLHPPKHSEVEAGLFAEGAARGISVPICRHRQGWQALTESLDAKPSRPLAFED